MEMGARQSDKLSHYPDIRIVNHNFFDLVSRLNKLREDERNESADIGKAYLPIIFKSNPSLSFRPRDVENMQSWVVDNNKAIPQISLLVNFLGMHGANSPIPAFYTEDMLGKTEDEAVSRQFLDLFNHRLIELFYQSWKKYQTFKRHQLSAGKAEKLIDQIYGIDYEERVEKSQLRYVAGLIDNGGMSAANLQKALQIVLKQQRVEVHENQVEELDIGEANYLQLGKTNSRLGQNSFVGRRIKTGSNRFLLKVWMSKRENADVFRGHIKQWLKVFGLSYMKCSIELIYAPDLIEPVALQGKASLGEVALGKTNKPAIVTMAI